MQHRALTYALPGLLCQFVAAIFLPGARLFTSTGAPSLSWWFVALLAIGTILLCGGLYYGARAKGYSGWWGLLGLLSIVGAVFVGALPRRMGRYDGDTEGRRRADAERQMTRQALSSAARSDLCLPISASPRLS